MLCRLPNTGHGSVIIEAMKLLSALLLAAASLPAQSLQGVVVNRVTGAPVDGVEVTLEETGTAKTWQGFSSGSGAANAITFPRTSLNKVTFRITGSSGTPKVAEFETYAA